MYLGVLEIREKETSPVAEKTSCSRSKNFIHILPDLPEQIIFVSKPETSRELGPLHSIGSECKGHWDFASSPARRLVHTRGPIIQAAAPSDPSEGFFKQLSFQTLPVKWFLS